MAAIPGTTVQNLFLSQHCQRNRELKTRYSEECCGFSMHRIHPMQGWKITRADPPAMQLYTLGGHQIAHGNKSSVICHAVQYTSSVPFLEKIDFGKLQNGSDIRGVVVAGVEGEPVNLTEPVSEAIAAAFTAWLREKKAVGSKRLRVSVGHDSRISAQNLQDAVSRGLSAAGVEVVQYGLASTPAMFNSTLTEDEEFLCPVDGAIMITASHLPYNRNGFKFFTNAGGLGKVDIKDILERAANIYKEFSVESLKESAAAASAVRKVDYMAIYSSELVKAVRKAAGSIDKPLEGFHIIVDAGNGAGGFFVGKVLEPLGAITSGSQFLEPDGLFPNHIPNPEDKDAMKAITQAVLVNKADLGIIFDTDVDRSAAVDSGGHEFNRNRLIALMSAIVLEQHPGTTIVTDSVTSDGLTTFIEKKLGGKHHMVGVVAAIYPPEKLRVSVRVFDPVTDSSAADELEEMCEVGTSGEVSLFTHLLGDPLARVRHSPAYRMLIAETCGAERVMVGLVRGCIRTVTCGKEDELNLTIPVYTKLAYILGLRVSPSYRRMGIGLKLVQKLEQWFNSMGADYAYMATDKDNEASVSLFTRRCGYTKFRTASILVQPVYAHRLPGCHCYVIHQLLPSDAELIYRKRLSTVEFFPQDIDSILNNYLSLGTFLAVPPGYNYCGVEAFLASPPPSWAVLSLWNCKEVFRLEVRGVTRLQRGLAAASRAIDKAMPWLRLPSVPNLFRPFGFYFIYGIGGEGDEAADMLRQLCRQAHNLAREGGCEVLAAEVAACEPLKSGIPHSRWLSCDDLWCMKRLRNDYNDSQVGDWAKSRPGTSIFVDPREV